MEDKNYKKLNTNELKSRLTKEQYAVTQEKDTEKPFVNEYWSNNKQGLYVEVTTGEPLFTSLDKFDSGCGWPSFSKPMNNEAVVELLDISHNMRRVEVVSKIGESHLGHLFDDGPKEKGGLRYCINSAALRFIPLDSLEKEGYGDYVKLFKEK